MNTIDIKKELEILFKNPEFLKLKEIGGHKEYHLEGDALKHTQLVIAAAEKKFDCDNSYMVLIAALHDVGKIYSSICNGPDDWKYPGHAKAGADNLHKFIPETHPLFEVCKWYVANHIKPLFWKDKKAVDLEVELQKILKNAPSSMCNIKNLALLALCDIEGSVSVYEDNPAKDFLIKFLNKF